MNRWYNWASATQYVVPFNAILWDYFKPTTMIEQQAHIEEYIREIPADMLEREKEGLLNLQPAYKPFRY